MNSRCDTTFIMNRMVIIICLSLLAIPAFCSYDPALLTPSICANVKPAPPLVQLIHCRMDFQKDCCCCCMTGGFDADAPPNANDGAEGVPKEVALVLLQARSSSRCATKAKLSCRSCWRGTATKLKAAAGAAAARRGCLAKCKAR